MIDQIFHVATEFRFNVGGAVLASQTLQNEVGKISEAADNTLLSFKQLGAGIVANLGLGSGGLLAILGKAIQVSDKFNNTALSFSNVISSNMKLFTGDIDSFNARLETSRVIMGDITKIANRFALPSNELLNLTKLVTPLMAQHGMAGRNFSGAIDLSKNLLKSAPNLGINPQDSEGQLLRAISGQAGMHDTLFRRLMTETPAFQDAHIKNSGQFNAMAPEKRITLLSKSLAVFASDTDVLKNRVNSLSGQMTILSNNIGEFGSVLRPLGDAFLKPIIMGLQGLNAFIEKDGKEVIANLAKLIANIVEEPKRLLINIMQASQLKGDMKAGSKMFGLIEGVLFLRLAVNFVRTELGLTGIGLMTVGRGIASIVGWFVELVPWMAVFSFAGRAFLFALTRIFPPLLAMIALMQTISRAKAIAKVDDAENVANLAARGSDLLLRFKMGLEDLFAPITDFIDWVAHGISPLFQITTWANLTFPTLEKLAVAFQLFGLGVKAFFEALPVLPQAFMNAITGDGMKGFDLFTNKMNSIIDDGMKRIIDPKSAVVNQVTNIGKVEIQNTFKEQQEPDRIAFSLKEQLMKAAKNPTQGRGTSQQAAFAR